MKSSKKSTSIKVFSDDEVVQHILGSKGNQAQKLRHRPDLEYNVEKHKSYYEASDSEDEMDYNVGPAGDSDHHDPDSLYGGDLFKFKTSKKAGQMALKAKASASPQTPKGKAVPASRGASPLTKPASSPATAARRTPSRRSKSGPLTPIPQRLAGPAHRQHTRAQMSTPYRLKKRNATTNEGGGASDSEDSIDESSEEEEDKVPAAGIENVIQTTDRKRTESDLLASAEAYFDIHSMNPVTSDRTLASLGTPRMDIESIRRVLKDLKPSHVKETSCLLEKHKALFNRWMLNMCQGWNILTYGVGSKRSLLESFRESHVQPFSHLVVNGYFPSLTPKHILNSITEEILGESKAFTSLFAQIEYIETYFKTHDEDFYLLIHNIDGMMLRSNKAQNSLSLLAAIPGVHLIASLDHINAAFLWDEIQFFRFRWLWYDTPTFLSYEAENAYENSLMVQQSGGLALSSMVHVMRSLTPNAKRIFLTLARFQLEAAQRVGYDGMSLEALYQQCREDFLVNSDLTLQAQLVEFKDHRLIRSKKNYEGIEHLLIPIDNSTLKAFLDEHKDTKS